MGCKTQQQHVVSDSPIALQNPSGRLSTTHSPARGSSRPKRTDALIRRRVRLGVCLGRRRGRSPQTRLRHSDSLANGQTGSLGVLQVVPLFDQLHALITQRRARRSTHASNGGETGLDVGDVGRVGAVTHNVPRSTSAAQLVDTVGRAIGEHGGLT